MTKLVAPKVRFRHTIMFDWCQLWLNFWFETSFHFADCLNSQKHICCAVCYFVGGFSVFIMAVEPSPSFNHHHHQALRTNLCWIPWLILRDHNCVDVPGNTQQEPILPHPVETRSSGSFFLGSDGAKPTSTSWFAVWGPALQPRDDCATELMGWFSLLVGGVNFIRLSPLWRSDSDSEPMPATVAAPPALLACFFLQFRLNIFLICSHVRHPGRNPLPPRFCVISMWFLLWTQTTLAMFDFDHFVDGGHEIGEEEIEKTTAREGHCFIHTLLWTSI